MQWKSWWGSSQLKDYQTGPRTFIDTRNAVEGPCDLTCDRRHVASLYFEGLHCLHGIYGDCKRKCQTTSLQNHQISTSHEMWRYWPAMAPTVSASPRKLTASHHKQPQVQSKCLALSGHAVLPYERLATWGHRSWAANSSYGMLWVHDPSSTMG